MNILRQISLSEKYRASVTALSICIHHVPEALDEFELEDISSQAQSVMTSNRSHYLTLLRDQKWLMESGQAAAHLALALKNLPNCVTVAITDLSHDLNHTFQKSNANQLLTTSMILPTSIDFVKQLISTTMAAINASGCVLETFSIGHMIEGIKIQQLPKLSSSQLGLSFFKLPHLSLEVDSSFDGIEDNFVASLLDWIKLFPSLRVLDLSFIPPLTRAQFSSLSRNLPVDGITTLLLGCLDCHYHDLIVLFKRHRDILRSITLDAVDLTGCVQPWRSILEIIRDETLIDSIELSCCISDERDISFGTYSQDGQMSTPTESYKFSREEIDAVIRALYLDNTTREPSF